MTAATASLGEFLPSRRARLSPEAAGVVSYGARRVPGLRREELAQLAGVSATYYTRFEPGHSTNASRSVIDALSRALQLDDDERGHLHDLARPAAGGRPRRPRPDSASAATVRLVTAMADVPAVVLGRMLFLDPHTRELYRDWPQEAARAVASLRLVAGRHPEERALEELVGELTVKSPEFASLWARHPVRNCVSGTKLLRHPEVGDLELEFQALQLPDDSGQRLLAYTAPAGSASEAALRLLARV